MRYKQLSCHRKLQHTIGSQITCCDNKDVATTLCNTLCCATHRSLTGPFGQCVDVNDWLNTVHAQAATYHPGSFIADSQIVRALFDEIAIVLHGIGVVCSFVVYLQKGNVFHCLAANLHPTDFDGRFFMADSIPPSSNQWRSQGGTLS